MFSNVHIYLWKKWLILRPFISVRLGPEQDPRKKSPGSVTVTEALLLIVGLQKVLSVQEDLTIFL